MSQIYSIENINDLEAILVDLGYKLIDCGDHWRSSAVYRDGRNPTSLFIYKNTGVWRDFGLDDVSRPIEALVNHHAGVSISGQIKLQDQTSFSVDIDFMSKVYPESSLDELDPNYWFYKRRGISEKIQKLYKTGLSRDGKFYRRMTFPIYNRDGCIFGWSGRAIDKDKSPKWKHVGKKRDWVYPCYVREEFYRALETADTIYLVESIGDSMALASNDMLNHFVLFGVSVQSKLLSKLIELSPRKIIISLNDDSNKGGINTGLVHSVKIYLDLLKFFPKEKLEISFPIKNDFGDMQQDEDDFGAWSLMPYKTNDILKKALAKSYESPDDYRFSKKHISQLKKINE